MIEYHNSLQGVDESKLAGFFVGWPKPPNPETFRKILQGSSHIVLAIDEEADGRVVGFINAISDGVLACYLPLLEVLPEYQGRGIGGELVKRMHHLLKGFYMVDLVCDEDLVPFYEKFGFVKFRAMAYRNYDRQAGL